MTVDQRPVSLSLSRLHPVSLSLPPPSRLSPLSSFSQSVDFTLLAAAHATAVATGPAAASARGGECTPWTAVTPLDGASAAQRAAWTEVGLDTAAAGRLAVLVLAGGQGTRLGSAAPKGCFDIGLPSGTTLFGLHAARLAKLRQLAADHGKKKGVEGGDG